ncbi:hypothetical protein B0H13DRAFT_2500401 [Mycena leptocephala]|nr:hypothetical protein B0H13DRAFT_2500401 [Mycena leptocephala]
MSQQNANIDLNNLLQIATDFDDRFLELGPTRLELDELAPGASPLVEQDQVRRSGPQAGPVAHALTPQSIYSSDLTAKLSILAVCRAWNQIGLEVLYQSRYGLGDLVRHLDISCMIPRGYSALFETETQKLFRLCSRLIHFGFVPTFLIPTITYLLPPLAFSITSLEYSGVVDFSVVLPSLVQLCSGLRSLALALPANYDDIIPNLSFPRLEDLRLSIPSNFSVLIVEWEVPRLQRLWLTDNPVEPFGSLIEVGPVLNAYGHNLTFLSLYLSPPSHLQEILDRCPSLEHLVLGPRVSTDSASFEHQKIKHIDFWGGWGGRSWVRVVVDSFDGGFPALRALRNFDVTFKYLWDLPVRFPPGELQRGVLGINCNGESGGDNVGQAMNQAGGETRGEDAVPSWLAALLEFIDPESVNGCTVTDDDSSEGDPSFVGDAIFENESDLENYSDLDTDSCVMTVSEEGI